MKTRHYQAVKQGDRVIVHARDPEAKQVFFSWGSDRGPSRMFYGREADLGDRYTHIDYKMWKWDLDADAVDEMIHNIADHIDDPDYYSGRTEKSRAKELLGLLKKVSR